MINAALLHNLFLLGLLLFLGWAAIEDFALLRIPNPVPTLITLLYLPYAVFSPIPLNVWGGVATGAIFFLIGMVLFIYQAMGGGDVKLMAAIGLWAGPHLGLPFLVVTGVAGGALALVACSPFRVYLGHAQTIVAARISKPPVQAGVLPYGIAIAIGGAFVASQLYVG